MDVIDFARTHKELYTAKRKVQEVVADSAAFFAVEDTGTPGGEAFQNAVQAMYSAVYTVKFAVKSEGRLDFKVNKLECLYLSDPRDTPIDQWQWRFLVRVPDGVTAKDLAQARKTLREKKGLDAKGVKRIRWKEGRAVQLLHVGPYDAVGETYRQLGEYAGEHGLEITGPAHEVYLNDPRRTAPEKLKTIVRLGVKTHRKR